MDELKKKLIDAVMNLETSWVLEVNCWKVKTVKTYVDVLEVLEEIENIL